MDTVEVLLGKINQAVAERNAAETDLVSKSKAVGLLLLEAKKLHPSKKDFEAFLRRVNGLHISRAYDLLRLAGGRAPTPRGWIGSRPAWRGDRGCGCERAGCRRQRRSRENRCPGHVRFECKRSNARAGGVPLL